MGTHQRKQQSLCNNHIKFKSLMFAYRVIAGSAPTYLNAPVRANVTPRMLRSSNERRLALVIETNLIRSSTLAA